MDCDSFVLSIKSENIIKDLKNLEDIFDFSNIDENHEFYSESIPFLKMLVMNEVLYNY